MKKLLVSAAGLAMLSAPAFAQDTASLDMAASISERCEVSLVGTNPNVLFGLDQTVANVDTVCNLPGIINLRITSDNGGALVNAGNGDSIPYTVDVLPNNVPDTNISGNGDNLSIAAPIDLFAPNGAVLGGLQIDLRVNVDDVENNGDSLFAGDYTDTVTFAIGANGTF